jgi:hypothetical protein
MQITQLAGCCAAEDEDEDEGCLPALDSLSCMMKNGDSKHKTVNALREGHETRWQLCECEVEFYLSVPSGTRAHLVKDARGQVLNAIRRRACLARDAHRLLQLEQLFVRHVVHVKRVAGAAKVPTAVTGITIVTVVVIVVTVAMATMMAAAAAAADADAVAGDVKIVLQRAEQLLTCEESTNCKSRINKRTADCNSNNSSK